MPVAPVIDRAGRFELSGKGNLARCFIDQRKGGRLVGFSTLNQRYLWAVVS